MAFAGLKKQINKANQYVTEKMGGAEGTKLDLDFMEMERKTDVTIELVEELQLKTKEYLQPNPTARAKMAAVKGISKLSGQAKSNTYPQPEGILSDCMLMYGKKLGDDGPFAQALIEFGESLRQMADVKYALDDNIKQNVLEPLHQLQTKDIKEVMHHRKKLQGRRLDFDCKRRRQAKGSAITDDEIRSAEDKFGESLQLAQMGMYNLLENDVEQVSQLVTFTEALYEYHSQCAEILKVLTETLKEKREEAEERPKAEFIPKTLEDLDVLNPEPANGGDSHSMKKFGHYGNSMSNNYSHTQETSTNFATNNQSLTSSHRQMYRSQGNLFPSNPNSLVTSPNFKSTKDMNYSSDFWLNAWNDSNSFANNGNVTKPTHLELDANGHMQAKSTNASPLPSPMRSPAKTPAANKQPCCQALYDFEPENPGELGFKENDMITLLSRVDENWYEGTVNGRTGYFPQSYVNIIVPFPN